MELGNSYKIVDKGNIYLQKKLLQRCDRTIETVYIGFFFPLRNSVFIEKSFTVFTIILLPKRCCRCCCCCGLVILQVDGCLCFLHYTLCVRVHLSRCRPTFWLNFQLFTLITGGRNILKSEIAAYLLNKRDFP